MLDFKDKRILNLKEEKIIHCKEIQFLRSENKQLTIRCNEYETKFEEMETTIEEEPKQLELVKESIRDITSNFHNKIEKLKLEKFLTHTKKSPKSPIKLRNMEKFSNGGKENCKENDEGNLGNSPNLERKEGRVKFALGGKDNARFCR